ncbi:hypothetical protein, partial [Rossellomorea oryzaecorticis]|uniref:hypothetical protein n=1 Tax=Rossellomorea oryzaecorticis TaxID=1396505 RepID=UPI003138F356
MNTIPFIRYLPAQRQTIQIFSHASMYDLSEGNIHEREQNMRLMEDMVPGSKQPICAWLKTAHLCLAQNSPFVPGSKQP